MKKYIAVILTGALLMSLAACSSGGDDISGPSSHTGAISSQKSYPRRGEYEHASFDLYNSPAEENGLAGDKIYIEGKMTEVSTLDGASFAVVEEENGNKWLFMLGLSSYIAEEIPTAYAGTTAIFYGEYQGYSSAKKMPAVLFEQGEAGGKKYDAAIFQKSAEAMADGIKESATPILYTELDSGDYAGQAVAIEGVIKSVKQYTHTKNASVKLLQKNGDGYDTAYLNTLDYETLGDGIKSLKVGEGFVGYGIVGDNNEVTYLAFESKEADFTLDDVIDAYAADCQSLSYEDISRSPDDYKGQKAAFTGKVVQVVEGTVFTDLRVNVSKGKYDTWEDTIYVSLSDYDKNNKILEDDIITVYGTMGGEKTYNTVMGGSKTLPLIYADYARQAD